MQQTDATNVHESRGFIYGVQVSRGTKETLYDLAEIETKLCTEVVKLAKQTPHIMSELIEKAQEAKLTLREVAAGIGEHYESIKPMKKDIIEELRGLRVATTTEVSAMIKPLEDLRKFFLGADHEKEIARLREFVDLCERLEKLKKSGFIDTVADTMLKLA